MKILTPPFNPELMDILNPFTEWFFRQDRSLIRLNGKPDKKEYHTEIDYLNIMKKKDNLTGYPEECHGIDMGTEISSTPLEWRKVIMKLDDDLAHYFCAAFSAVKMYYPPSGYMGWHCNANCPGYNILMSYTEHGRGKFRYQDPMTQEIVECPDQPGWNAKVGYFGSWKEKDKIVWHSARSGGDERVTLAYVIPHKELWEMMCEDIKMNC